MTISEGLPLNSKYIKMGREAMRGGGLQADCLKCWQVFHVKPIR